MSNEQCVCRGDPVDCPRVIEVSLRGPLARNNLQRVIKATQRRVAYARGGKKQYPLFPLVKDGSKAGIKGLSLLTVILFMLLTACGIEDDTGFAVVRELRVAGIIAEPAEPLPGEVVHLRAVAVDPESRELAYLWFNPPNVLDPNQGIPEGIQPIAFSSDFDWIAPETEGTYTLIVFVVPVEFLPELTELDDFNNLIEIPHAIAFKNISISTSGTRNRNPVIEDVAINPPEFKAGDRIALTAVARDEDGDELQFAWLSITPGLSSDYENPVEFKIPADNSIATVYLVVRDSRGGSALMVLELK